MDPSHVLQQFYRTLMQSQCHVCFAMMSNETQKAVIDWILKDIYTRKPKAAEASQIGAPEVKIMIESNDTLLMKSFWKHFYMTSRAYDYVYYGQYEVTHNDNAQATVKVVFRYPNGHVVDVQVQMFKQRGDWKLGYIESKLPW